MQDKARLHHDVSWFMLGIRVQSPEQTVVDDVVDFASRRHVLRDVKNSQVHLYSHQDFFRSQALFQACHDQSSGVRRV